MKTINEWAEQEAKWWQCWRPRSGLLGGLILGGSIGISLILLSQLWT